MEIFRATLRDYPFILPLGISKDDRVLKVFSVKNLTGLDEIELGKIELEFSFFKKENKMVNLIFMKRMCNFLLREVLESIEGEQEKNFDVEELYLEDIVSLILNTRFKNYGELLSFSFTCPCPEAKKIEMKDEESLDLGSWEINFIEDPRIISKKISLETLEREVLVSPIKFGELRKVYENEDLSMKERKVLLFSDLKKEELEKISYAEIKMLLREIKEIEEIGHEKKIPFSCPHCGYEWESLLFPSINYESFIFNLLSCPRTKDCQPNENPALNYLNKIAFFLTVGEQAPFSSAEEVFRLDIKSRNFWVEELQKTYQKQKEEMQKSRKSVRKPSIRRPRKR